jgi:hypothetical protein
VVPFWVLARMAEVSAQPAMPSVPEMVSIGSSASISRVWVSTRTAIPTSLSKKSKIEHDAQLAEFARRPASQI